MSTVHSYYADIITELKSVFSDSIFKAVTFGDLGAGLEYPSVHVILEGMDKFDDPHIVNTTMQLRWELFFKVHVLHAGMSNPSTWEEAVEMTHKALEIFINQMPATERLDSEAWWIEPSNITYGVIGVDAGIDQNGVMGGTFDLNIKFLQNV